MVGMLFEFEVEDGLLDKDEYQGNDFDRDAMNDDTVMARFRRNVLLLLDKIEERPIYTGCFSSMLTLGSTPGKDLGLSLRVVAHRTCGGFGIGV